jgi:hypothetical protein
LQLQHSENTGHFQCNPRIVSRRIETADTPQMQTSHTRRIYDYRIQEAIGGSGDRDLFPELEIPRSTIRSWIHRGGAGFTAVLLMSSGAISLPASVPNSLQKFMPCGNEWLCLVRWLAC